MKSLAEFRNEPAQKSQLSTRQPQKMPSLSISAKTLSVITTLQAVYPTFRIPKDEPARSAALAVWDKVIIEFCVADIDRVLDGWQKDKGPDFCSSREFYKSLKAIGSVDSFREMPSDLEKDYLRQLNKRLEKYQTIINNKKGKTT